MIFIIKSYDFVDKNFRKIFDVKFYFSIELSDPVKTLTFNKRIFFWVIVMEHQIEQPSCRLNKMSVLTINGSLLYVSIYLHLKLRMNNQFFFIFFSASNQSNGFKNKKY